MSDSSNRPGSSSASDGNYVVVARRYRPRGFDELVGQDHVGRALRNAIETNRVGHAYLFTGARGVGKTSTARIFAKALNDPAGPTPTPDNTTDVAAAIDSGEDVDVIEIDGASNRGIDEIRTLRSNVGVRPSRSRYKIYIIDEVHMLTGAAFNALLKTLEEPPEHVKFIFCTTDPEKIPITVLSRCQRFDFAPVEVPKIVERLREIVQAEAAAADDDALELIARRAAGSMRDSQSLLEQVLSFSDGKLTAEQVHQMLGTADDQRLHALATAMAAGKAADALGQLDLAIDAGVDAGRMAEQLLGYLRDVMTVAVGCDASMLRHTSAQLHGELQQLAESWGLQTVLAVVALVDETLVRIRHSVHSRVLLEAALIQVCNLPDLQHLADLAEAAGHAAGASSAVEKKNAPVKPPHFNLGPRPTDALDPPRRAQAADRSQHLSPHAGASDVATDAVEAESAAAVSGQPSAAAAVATKPLATRAASWDQRRAEEVWQLARANLELMTETLARAIGGVEAAPPAKLRLLFPADASLAYRRCELPEHKTALQQAAEQAAGHDVSIELKLLPAKPQQPAVVAAPANRPSRAQRMREIENHQWIRSCIDLFGAEIVRIDKPR